MDNLLILSIRDIAKRPNTGRKTEFDKVRIKIVRKYQIFYEVIKRDLVILSIGMEEWIEGALKFDNQHTVLCVLKKVPQNHYIILKPITEPRKN